MGLARKYENGSDKGLCAVRWDALSTAATELGCLGTDSNGVTYARACAINTAGTAVGYSEKFVGGVSVGSCAVRWDAAGTVATELGGLGISGVFGTVEAQANAISDAGAAVGLARKYDNGNDVGSRAVRWDAASTAVIELGNLGTDGSGYTYSNAYAVNNVGTAVGLSQKYVDGTLVGEHAVIWLPDASVIDLNDLGVAPCLLAELGPWATPRP